MTSTETSPMKTLALIVLALTMAAMGMYVARADPPGAPIGGFLLMVVPPERRTALTPRATAMETTAILPRRVACGA